MRLVFVLLSLIAGVWCQSMNINTPVGVVSGSNVLITFTGGQAPYTLQVTPGNAGAPLATYQVSGSPYTWSVTQPGGMTVVLQLRDSRGVLATTAQFTIQGGAAGGGVTSTQASTTTNEEQPTSSTPSPTSQSTSTIPRPLPTQNSPTTPPSSTSPNSATTNSQSQSSESSSSTSSSNPSDFPTGPSKQVNTGAIIGGVVGGVVVVGTIIAAFGIILFRKRSKRLQSQSQMNQTPGTAPFLLPSETHTRSNDVAPVTAFGQPYSSPHGGAAQLYYGPPPGAQVDAPALHHNSSGLGVSSPPPIYGEQAYMESSFVPTAAYNPAYGSPMGSTTGAGGGASEQVVNDIIGQYAEANRDLISPLLEAKLRAARYLPTDDPSEVSGAEWQSQYGVGFLELKRLKEAYERNKPSGVKEKAVHSAGQGGYSWRPS